MKSESAPKGAPDTITMIATSAKKDGQRHGTR